MKILVDAYCALNFGDDLFLKILFDRYKNVEWVISTDDKRYLEVFKDYPNVEIEKNIFHKILEKFRMGNLFQNEANYNKYDAFICIGGSMYIQNTGWESLYQYRKKIITLFKKKDKKVFLLGSNFGPYTDEIFYNKYKELFKICDDVCFRDSYSYELFNDLTNVRFFPDIVFQIPQTNMKKNNNSIGISVIDISNREKLSVYKDIYTLKLKEIIEYYIDKGYSITLFSFCNDQGDKKIIDQIKDAINPNKHSFIKSEEYTGNINRFLNEFSKMEKIIGVRFHASILSQVFQQDLYPIIYSNKTYNVLKDINLLNNYTRIEEIETLDIKKLDNIITNNKVDVHDIVKNSKMQFKQLDIYLKGAKINELEY